MGQRFRHKALIGSRTRITNPTPGFSAFGICGEGSRTRILCATTFPPKVITALPLRPSVFKIVLQADGQAAVSWLLSSTESNGTMASISYWFLSPSLMMAMIGKLRGWDRTVATPTVDWKKVVVDVVLPAKNEEKAIALALSSLAQQDFPYRRVVVFDDGSTDQTSRVVERYRQLSGREIQLVRREKSIGKTPSLREFCEQTDADAMVILDADTVLVSPNYISRLVEELFKNAGVSAACGEVMPLTQRRRNLIAKGDENVRAVQSEFSLPTPAKESFWLRFLTTLTILYRAPMYILLQRTLYDGTLKLFGGQLNPVGCAVAYKTKRLQECFD